MMVWGLVREGIRDSSDRKREKVSNESGARVEVWSLKCLKKPSRQ